MTETDSRELVELVAAYEALIRWTETLARLSAEVLRQVADGEPVAHDDLERASRRVRDTWPFLLAQRQQAERLRRHLLPDIDIASV